MRVSFGATIRPNDDDGRPEEFDKVPTSASDGEDIGVIADITQDLEGSVVLEKEVHFDADTADILEHVGELHVFGIGPKAIEADLVVIRRLHIAAKGFLAYIS